MPLFLLLVGCLGTTKRPPRASIATKPSPLIWTFIPPPFLDMRLSIFTLFLIFLFRLSVSGQDLHYSQFYLNPLHSNPATTGVFEGNMRFSGLYRSQWSSVPVSYQSFAGAADWKALQRGTNLISVGFLLQHDRAGDGALTWTQVGVTGAVTQALGETQAIGVGFGFGFAQRGVDLGGLTFKNQWTGDVFDRNLPSMETLNNSTGLVPTLSGGANWHYGPADSRNRLDAGIGASHLNRPKFSFDQTAQTRLPMRVTLNIGGTFEVAERLDLVAFGMAQQMAGAREIVVGAGVRSILSSVAGNMMAVQFSLATRTGDAIIPAVQFERNNWTVGLSYDVNTSPFKVATDYRGGFEIGVVYRNIPVPPLKAVKTCPIF